jgi:hypothetical protein
MIESSVVSWLSGVSGVGGRVYTGSRLQASVLPALVVDVAEGEPLCIGATPKLTRFSVTVEAIAETMASAQTIAALIDAAMTTGATGAGGCSVQTRLPSLAEPVLGEGDEAEPAICTATFEVYTNA